MLNISTKKKKSTYHVVLAKSFYYTLEEHYLEYHSTLSHVVYLDGENECTFEGNFLKMIGLNSLFISSLFNWTRAIGVFLHYLSWSFWIFVILDPMRNYQFLPERWRLCSTVVRSPNNSVRNGISSSTLVWSPSNTEWKGHHKQIHLILEWVIKSQGKKQWICSEWLDWTLYLSILFLIGQGPLGYSFTIFLGVFGSL